MKNSREQNRVQRTGLVPIPFFSVVVTTYNRANLISRALNSILSQTEKDWEAIIVDDESTDNTYFRILPYLMSNCNIFYIRQSHKGEPTAKNTGLWSASGKFVTFLDSDDEYNPLHLESRKVVLKKNPSVKFLYGGIKILGNQFVPDRFNYEKKVNLNNCVIGGTFFIERNIALSLNGFRNILYAADADLFERAKNANITLMKINSPTYIYHHETDDSITNNLLAGL